MEFVSVAGLITVFRPATRYKVDRTFSTLAVKAPGFSAVRAKSLTRRIASSRFTLLSRFASSGLKRGNPDESIMTIRTAMQICLAACIGTTILFRIVDCGFNENLFVGHLTSLPLLLSILDVKIKINQKRKFLSNQVCCYIQRFFL